MSGKKKVMKVDGNSDQEAAQKFIYNMFFRMRD